MELHLLVYVIYTHAVCNGEPNFEITVSRNGEVNIEINMGSFHCPGRHRTMERIQFTYIMPWLFQIAMQLRSLSGKKHP
jgi:hypothetical protein